MALRAAYLHLLDTITHQKDISVWKLMRFQHETLPEYNAAINDLKAQGLINVDKDGKVHTMLLGHVVVRTSFVVV